MIENTNEEYWWGIDWNTNFPTGGTNAMEHHIKNTIIHVTQADKDRWNNKKGIDFKIVDVLPATGETGTIYLVPAQPSGETGNLYDEYVYITDEQGQPKWEKIGSTKIDISGKQDKLVNQVNIKSINGETLLINSSGDPKNVVIKSAHPFLSTFNTTGTPSDLCTSIINTAEAVGGMVYLGGVSCSTSRDWPTSVQAECMAYVIENVNHQKVIVLYLYSADQEPYSWERIYWNGFKMNWLPNDSYNKVTKTTLTNKIYGTDNSGETTYNVSDFQTTLVSGTNIKTINSNSLLGSGNINIRTFSDVDKSMDEYKDKYHTVEQYLTEFTNKIHPETGNAYLTSGIEFSNLPKSFHMEYGDAGCEMFIYVPKADYSETEPNVVYVLEIETTNNFAKLWYGGPGKFMGIYQVEGGSVSTHMSWKGIMTCPQYTASTIDGEYKYIPVDDSDGASKYYVDKELLSKQDKLIPGTNIEISGNTINAFPSGGTVNGDLTANGFYETSDIRKKNILCELDIDTCYDMINKCSEIIYTLKDDETKQSQIGMIAQEVENIFPELVLTDKDGFKSLDYSRISVILMRVMKEILKELKELKK